MSQVGQRLPWALSGIRRDGGPGTTQQPKAARSAQSGRAGDLLAQDGDLVPEHPDLRVLSGVASREERQPANSRVMSR